MAPVAIAPEAFIARLRAFGEPVAVGGEGVAAGGPRDRPSSRCRRPGSPAHRLSAAALVRRVRTGAGVPARPVYARLPDAEVARLRAIAAAGA